MSATPERNGKTGGVIATIVVLAVIIIGALYFWGQRAGESISDKTLESINAQSSSDETVNIEADLNATDLEDLDSELNEEDFNAS